MGNEKDIVEANGHFETIEYALWMRMEIINLMVYHCQILISSTIATNINDYSEHIRVLNNLAIEIARSEEINNDVK